MSHAISRSQIAYANAFIYTVQDDEDLSYFIDYNLKKITDAFHAFESSVIKEESENNTITKYNLNKRQLRFIKELTDYPEVRGSVSAYMALNKISRRTAEYDFRELIDQNIITKEKFIYHWLTLLADSGFADAYILCANIEMYAHSSWGYTDYECI